MNKYTIKTILLVTAFTLSTPVMANDNLYMSAQVGGVILNDGDNQGELLQIESSYDTGFSVGGTIGYEVHPAVSIEGEINYRYNAADSLSITSFPLDPSFNGATASADGSISSLSAMVNAKAYLNGLHGRDEKGGFYALGGVGVANVNADIDVSGLQVVDDSDTVLAYQVGMGYEVAVNEDISIDLGYRYFGTSDFALDDAAGDEFDAEYQSHTIMVGMVKRF